MSYQNYTIREVDGKLELFDETGENVHCRTSISPNNKIFFTTWGVFEFSKRRFKKERYPQLFSTLVFDGKRLWRDAKSAMQFTKNGHVGWKAPSGDLIMPPIFDQIEICRSFIWAKYANREIFIYKNGCLSEGEKSDNKFYENGKIGLKNPDGTILFPAIYDKIYQWSDDSDVYYTCIGEEFHYYNSKHEEILTSYRKFEGVDDECEPYHVHEAQNHKILITMQITEDLSDSQSCVCFGQKVRLDRILKSEVRDIIENHCEVWRKGVYSIDSFNSAFTYIYSAYYAQSKSDTPIEDCLSQFQKMGCYDTSWSFMVKIWTNRNTRVSNAQLSKLVWHFQDMISGMEDPMEMVTIGYDDSLADGEVKMFQVNYFSDHWPIYELDMIFEDALSGDIANYNRKMDLLEETLEKERAKGNWTDDKYESLRDEYFGKFSISDIYEGFDLKKSEELLNYLVRKEGWSVLSTVLRICQRLYLYVSKCNVESVDETNRAYKKIKWALNHHPSLKLVIKGKSCLDFIRESIQVLEESNKKGQKGKLQILRKIERLLLKNGAHTATEIRNESFDPYNLW